MLGHELTKRYGGAGLPDDTIDVTSPARPARASAPSCPSGITLRLEGDANDYVGKGLSGGRLDRPPAARRARRLRAEDNIIAGNVILYGATGGEVFLRGRRRRAVLRAQLRAPPPWSRAWATTAAST